MLINSLIDHRLLRPVALSVIAIIIIFRFAVYLNYFIKDYRELAQRESLNHPIKIVVSGLSSDAYTEQNFSRIVKAGDTLLKILLDLGASESDAFAIIEAAKQFFSANSLSQGDQINISYRIKIAYKSDQQRIGGEVNKTLIVDKLVLNPSSERQIIITNKGNGIFEAKEKKLELMRHVSRYHGVLSKGLYVDGVESGISPASMMNMINLYGYDVDFQRDIRAGDKFEMLVESFYTEDGKKIRDGNVLFSSLTLKDRVIENYMYKISGNVEYFDANGNSVKKSLLRTPLNAARITSKFGLRRHPILGYSKMHKGIDFGAPSGTPIMAAGNGTISYYGRKGGYGNYVEIKHNEDYRTAYGHASKFAKGLHLGSKVKQGDIVAYVGSTGFSTGPHLHFEVLYKGQAINPSKVKATSGIRLSGGDLAKFRDTKNEIDRYRKNIPNLFKKS